MGDANVNALHVGPGGVGVLMQGPATPAPCTLPPYEDVRFVGRVRELAALDAWGQSDGRVLVLHGPPGVGKTRLAVEWAHRQAAAFPGGRYFLSFRADPHGALHEVARLRSVRREPDERLDEWAIRTLHHLGAEQALVIFDDLQSAAEFGVWFGHLSTARAVVVTNERVWPSGYTRVPVEVLELDDARALARGVIGDEAAAARHVDGIVERAGRNAVQIVVDAAAVHEAVELGDSPSLPPVPAPEALESFERAWGTATEEARAFVCALALYRAQGTPTARVVEVLGADGWSDEKARKASSEAVRRHLVARDAEALTMHPLLRAFARRKGADVLTAAMREAHARAFVARAKAFAESPGDRTKYAEIAHDEFDLAVWDARGWTLSPSERMEVGEALHEAGRFTEARGWYERAADETRQGDIHGRIDHHSLGVTLHEVGRCLSSHGQFAAARGWYERAADEKRQGDFDGRVDHQSLGKSLHEVGSCLSLQGQFVEARAWYEHAASEARLGDLRGRVDHQSLGSTSHQVGRCLSSRGQFVEALAWYERAADEKRQGDIHGRVDHQLLGASLHQVGLCLSSQGQFVEALDWYERAADEKRQGDIHGRFDHQSLGITLNLVGRYLFEQGQFAEARVWHERAADEKRQGDIYSRVDHQSLGLTLHEVGLCLSLEGRGAESRSFYKRAVDEMHRGNIYGRVDHHTLSLPLRALGDAAAQEMWFSEARDWYERAVASGRKGNLYGRIHTASLAESLDLLADTLYLLGLADEARLHREEAARLRASLPNP